MATYCEEISCAGDGRFNVALSLQKALTFSQEEGFTQLIVEFSHPHLKSLISQSEVYISEIEDILSRIRDLSNIFNSLSFFSISRSCNKATKILANYAK